MTDWSYLYLFLPCLKTHKCNNKLRTRKHAEVTCKNRKLEGQPGVYNLIGRKLKPLADKQKPSNLPKELKNELREKLANFITMDLQPLSTIEGAGFIELADTLLKLGAAAPGVKWTDIRICRNTIRSDILKKEETIKEKQVYWFFYILVYNLALT